MSDTIISVDNLSKCYLVGHQSGPQRYQSLRENLVRHGKNFGRKAVDMFRGRQVVQGDEVEEFWALKEVSFEVKRGEVLGIIGRNGAGKSTLLKILSRITEPTSGRVTLRGRVASLLEVGTGFHPELTGRENVFLNGAILGMTRGEIRSKFDEIIDFAGVEKFLDTPVKRYSSGMYVRLAFAVAAHLEPEILVVDEVLAVGDAEFQKKCLGKMQDVAQGGRTVLFVSHDLSAISTLTQKCILLQEGRIVALGSTPQTIAQYHSKRASNTTYVRLDIGNPSGPFIKSVSVLTSNANSVHESGLPLEIQVDLQSDRLIKSTCLSIQIVNQFQQPATHIWTHDHDLSFLSKSHNAAIHFHFENPRLNVGSYYLKVYLSEPPGGEMYEVLDGVCTFEVVKETVATLWGWRPESCVYHEEYSVSLLDCAQSNSNITSQ